MSDLELLTYNSIEDRKEDRKDKRRDSEQVTRRPNGQMVQKSMTFSPGDKKIRTVPFKSGSSKKKTLEIPKIQIT